MTAKAVADLVAIEPPDGGPAPPPEPGEQSSGAHGRKIRPIGLSECLVKLAENMAIESAMAQVKAATEPIQLGAATPDGCAVATRILRAWTAAARQDGGRTGGDSHH